MAFYIVESDIAGKRQLKAIRPSLDEARDDLRQLATSYVCDNVGKNNFVDTLQDAKLPAKSGLFLSWDAVSDQRRILLVQNDEVVQAGWFSSTKQFHAKTVGSFYIVEATFDNIVTKQCMDDKVENMRSHLEKGYDQIVDDYKDAVESSNEVIEHSKREIENLREACASRDETIRQIRYSIEEKYVDKEVAARLRATQEDLDDYVRRLRLAERKYAELCAQNDERREALINAEVEVASLAARLKTAEAAVEDAQTNVLVMDHQMQERLGAAYQRENALNAEIAEYRTEIAGLKTQLAASQEANASLQRRVSTCGCQRSKPLPPAPAPSSPVAGPKNNYGSVMNELKTKLQQREKARETEVTMRSLDELLLELDTSMNKISSAPAAPAAKNCSKLFSQQTILEPKSGRPMRPIFCPGDDCTPLLAAHGEFRFRNDDMSDSDSDDSSVDWDEY